MTKTITYKDLSDYLDNNQKAGKIIIEGIARSIAGRIKNQKLFKPFQNYDEQANEDIASSYFSYCFEALVKNPNLEARKLAPNDILEDFFIGREYINGFWINLPATKNGIARIFGKCCDFYAANPPKHYGLYPENEVLKEIEEVCALGSDGKEQLTALYKTLQTKSYTRKEKFKQLIFNHFEESVSEIIWDILKKRVQRLYFDEGGEETEDEKQLDADGTLLITELSKALNKLYETSSVVITAHFFEAYRDFIETYELPFKYNHVSSVEISSYLGEKKYTPGLKSEFKANAEFRYSLILEKHDILDTLTSFSKKIIIMAYLTRCKEMDPFNKDRQIADKLKSKPIGVKETRHQATRNILTFMKRYKPDNSIHGRLIKLFFKEVVSSKTVELVFLGK